MGIGVVLDIDGTLADSESRILRNTVGEETDWEKALSLEEVIKDPPLQFGNADIISLLSPWDKVIFLTNRPKSLFEVTHYWLMKYIVKDAKFQDFTSEAGFASNAKYIICMKDNNDNRNPTICKEEMLRSICRNLSAIYGSFSIISAFDDVSEGNVEERKAMYESFGAIFYHVDNKQFWENFNWAEYHKRRQSIK